MNYVSIILEYDSYLVCFSSSSSTTDICVAGNCMFYVQRVNLAVLKQKQKNEICKYKPPDKIPIFNWEMKFVYR